MAELPSLREPQWAWLARQINDERLSAEEIVGIVRHHPWIKRALDLAPDVPRGWSSELEAHRIRLCVRLTDHADGFERQGWGERAAAAREAEMGLTLLASLVWPPKSGESPYPGQLRDALVVAEAFMAGFEGDKLQEDMALKLWTVRTALAALDGKCFPCGAQPVATVLDGETLCKACADNWVRGEGIAAMEAEEREREG